MHLQVLSSGSRGNACLIRAGETHVLVDAGLPADELDARFRAAGYEPRRLDHLLVTHGHLDHARSAGRVARRAQATLHCAQRVMHNRSVRRAKRFAALRIGGEAVLGTGPREERDPVRVRAVPLPHDAEPTVAFRLEHAGRCAVVLTDCGHPRHDLAGPLRGAHVIVLEFNHDRELLLSGSYSDALKRRVAGDRGHLSNDQACELLRGLAGPELHTLVLAHLSAENNRPLLALGAAKEALAELGLGHVEVLVAGQDAVGPNLVV